MPDLTDIVKKTKLTESENKITDITGLAIKLLLIAVQNKIPEVSNLVRKTNYDTKISERETKLTDHNHGKYITTQEFSRRSGEQ